MISSKSPSRRIVCCCRSNAPSKRPCCAGKIWSSGAGRGQTTTFARFWRRHSDVQAATRSLAAYDFELRATLQHLLAARLAERHGISLYDDPEAARRLLAGGGRDRLWFWLDPGREAVTDEGRAAGIPPRTLAAIIDRLEHL